MLTFLGGVLEIHPKSKFEVIQPSSRIKSISSSSLVEISTKYLNRDLTAEVAARRPNEIEKRYRRYLRWNIFNLLYNKFKYVNSPPELCTDVLIGIFSYLSRYDLARLQLVCRDFRTIIWNVGKFSTLMLKCADDWQLECKEHLFEPQIVTNRKLIRFILSHHPAYKFYESAPIQFNLTIKAASFKASCINRKYFHVDQLQDSYTLSIKFHGVVSNPSGNEPVKDFFITVEDKGIFHTNIFSYQQRPFGFSNRFLSTEECPRIINSFFRTLNPQKSKML
ncbi:MAG: F-box protein [Parachlamydiales bacterium]|jgi:hypothetical protein